MSATEAVAPKPKNARRRSRELAVQFLYAWLVSDTDADTLKQQARDDEGFRHLDAALFDRLIDGVIAEADPLRDRLRPLLDRSVRELSPVEHAILLIGARELSAHPETPYKVIINEAVELARVFGGTDGHKYVNGVLDRLALELRPGEAVRRA